MNVHRGGYYSVTCKECHQATKPSERVEKLLIIDLVDDDSFCRLCDYSTLIPEHGHNCTVPQILTIVRRLEDALTRISKLTDETNGAAHAANIAIEVAQRALNVEEE